MGFSSGAGFFLTGASFENVNPFGFAGRMPPGLKLFPRALNAQRNNEYQFRSRTKTPREATTAITPTQETDNRRVPGLRHLQGVHVLRHKLGCPLGAPFSQHFGVLVPDRAEAGDLGVVEVRRRGGFFLQHEQAAVVLFLADTFRLGLW
jgi:hypothetical protein